MLVPRLCDLFISDWMEKARHGERASKRPHLNKDINTGRGLLREYETDRVFLSEGRGATESGEKNIVTCFI